MKLFGVKQVAPQRSGKQALCLSGHIRNLKAASLIRKVFTGDIFLATWDYLDVNSSEITTKEICDLYNPIAVHIEDSLATAEWLKRKWQILEQKNYIAWKGRKPWETYAMYYMMKKAWELRRKHEIKNKFRYDLVVRFRPDYIYRGLDIIPEENTLYSPANGNYPPQDHPHHPLELLANTKNREAKIMTDNLFCGDSFVMDQIQCCYDFLDFYMLAENCPWNLPGWNNEALLYHHIQQQNVLIEPLEGFTYQMADGQPPGGDQEPVHWKPNDLLENTQFRNFE